MLISELNISFTIDQSTFGINNLLFSTYPIRLISGITKILYSLKQDHFILIESLQCNSNKVITNLKV